MHSRLYKYLHLLFPSRTCILMCTRVCRLLYEKLMLHISPFIPLFFSFFFLESCKLLHLSLPKNSCHMFQVFSFLFLKALVGYSCVYRLLHFSFPENPHIPLYILFFVFWKLRLHIPLCVDCYIFLFLKIHITCSTIYSLPWKPMLKSIQIYTHYLPWNPTLGFVQGKRSTCIYSNADPLLTKLLPISGAHWSNSTQSTCT